LGQSPGNSRQSQPGQNQATSGTARAETAPDQALIEKSKADFLSEETQYTAIKDFQDYLIENFPNITISNVEGSLNKRSTSASNKYIVEFTWEHTDKESIVRGMVTFFQALADANQGDRKRKIEYFPTSYAVKPQGIEFPLFSKANRQLQFGFEWRFEFTLFDKDGFPIDRYKPSLPSLTRYSPWGKYTKKDKGYFYLTEEAYSMIKEVRLTNITGERRTVAGVDNGNLF
jgi:hypothetical protein